MLVSVFTFVFFLLLLLEFMKVVLSLNRYFVNMYAGCLLIMNEKEYVNVYVRVCACVCACIIDPIHYSKPCVIVCYNIAVVIPTTLAKHSNCTSIWVTNGMNTHFSSLCVCVYVCV